MRPQVDDELAEVVEEIAEELSAVDPEMLTFNQQLTVILKNLDEANLRDRHRNITRIGKVVSRL